MHPNMRHIPILLTICLLTLHIEVGAQTARQCFLQLPDSLCPLLTEVNRADCIDFLESHMKAQVTNRFGGQSEMTRLTDDYIALQVSALTSWQMKLLPVADGGKVICVVSTACAPACDSSIRFYSTDWKPLPSDLYLPARPTANDFLSAPSDSLQLATFQTVRREADYPLMRADLSADEPLLTWTFTTPDFLSADLAEKLKPYLRPARIWAWQEGRFVPQP